ncbi:hypothetical protein DV735_g4362, partial [Chaetothyriales sp. CBS 134920]
MASILRSLVLLGILVALVFSNQAHAFGAGNIASISAVEGRNWRHGDIEDILKQVSCIRKHKWNSMMIKRVYFGNWLRDYSQAMDTGALKKAQPETIRILVWLLSFLGFGYATAEFEVTSERLGVYRPEEHIDNPKDYNDNLDAREYDARLRGPVRDIELEIDPETGMKNYIANGKGDWATSAAFVKYSFEQSIRHGRKYVNGQGFFGGGNDEDLAEACRLLGQGLHTLEDFGAHTNYVELALIEMGHRNVFPHVGSQTMINLHGKHVYPLVTGTFGMVDFYHSVLGEATDHFTQSEVNEMDNALGIAEQAAQSNNPLTTLIKLLSKVPGTSHLVAEAQQLSAYSQAQARSIEQEGWGGARGVDDGYSFSRAGPGDYNQGHQTQWGQAEQHQDWNKPQQPQWTQPQQHQDWNQTQQQQQPQWNQPQQPQWNQPQQPQWNQPSHQQDWSQPQQHQNWNQPQQSQQQQQHTQSYNTQTDSGAFPGQQSNWNAQQGQHGQQPQQPQPQQSSISANPSTGAVGQSTPDQPLQQPASVLQSLPGIQNFDPAKFVQQIYPILAFRDKVVRAISSVIEKIPGLEALVERIEETLTVFILSLLAPFVRPVLKGISKTLQTGSSTVIDSSGKHQYEVWTNPQSSDPTHSMLSKDHFSNILNDPAGNVAAEILKFIAPRVLYAWEHEEVPIERVMADIDIIFHHPAIRNQQNEVHRNMYQAVQTWVSRYRGTTLDQILSSESVRAGKNHIAGHGGQQPQQHQSYGNSSGGLADVLNLAGKLPIPGASNLSTFGKLMGATNGSSSSSSGFGSTFSQLANFAGGRRGLDDEYIGKDGERGVGAEDDGYAYGGDSGPADSAARRSPSPLPMAPPPGYEQYVVGGGEAGSFYEAPPQQPYGYQNQGYGGGYGDGR